MFEAENSQPVSLAQVPPHVINAFLAVEDKRVLQPRRRQPAQPGAGHAVQLLVRRAAQQGASTITMQVVKNDFLAGLERDGRYKLLQVHYALMLDRAKTKDEILERYLNTVFFGNNAYGIQAASEVYFGKTVDQLTFIEAAFLAGLVRSPSGYDPVINPERSRSRFDQVLERLVDDGVADRGRGDPDRHRRSCCRTGPARRPAASTPRTYYTEALREYLLEPVEPARPDLRRAVRHAVPRRTAHPHHVRPFASGLAEQARNVLPDNPAGLRRRHRLAGHDHRRHPGDGRRPGLRAQRAGDEHGAGAPPDRVEHQAVRAGRRDPGRRPGRRHHRRPEQLRVRRTRRRRAVRRSGGDQSGARHARPDDVEVDQLRLRAAVADRRAQPGRRHARTGWPSRSTSTPASREEQRTPIEPFISYSTGANEMSPLDMAAGGQTIANDGLHHEPYYVEYIDTADGRRIYTHASAGTQVLDRAAALTTVDMLKGVLTEGTARSYPLDGGRPAAGKTGTQQDNTNAWFVGFTPHLTTAVWVGDPNGYTPMVNVPEFGGRNASRVAGWPVPDADLEDVHGPGPRRAAADRLGAAAGAAPARRPGCTCPATSAWPAPSRSAATSSAPCRRPPHRRPASPARRSHPRRRLRHRRPRRPPPPGSPITAPRATRLVPIESGTTVPPDVLDPRAPLPSTPRSSTITAC